MKISASISLELRTHDHASVSGAGCSSHRPASRRWSPRSHVSEHGRLTREAFDAGLGRRLKFHKLAQRHGSYGRICAVATAAIREAATAGESCTPSLAPPASAAGHLRTERRTSSTWPCATPSTCRTARLSLRRGRRQRGDHAGDARSLSLGQQQARVQRLARPFGGGAALGKRERRQLEPYPEVASPTLQAARARGFDFVVGPSAPAWRSEGVARARGVAWAQRDGRIVRLDQLKLLTEDDSVDAGKHTHGALRSR